MTSSRNSMQSFPEIFSDLIDDLFFDRISPDQFLSKINATRETIESVISAILEQGIKEQNGEIIAAAIIMIYTFGIIQQYLASLNILAIAPWHQDHEDVVFALGMIKDPSSVGVLTETAVAQYPYLENDDAYALGSKSIYALKNIQTSEAIRVLGDLARSENEILKTTAIGRLKEIAMKGESAAARTLAQNLLDR